MGTLCVRKKEVGLSPNTPRREQGVWPRWREMRQNVPDLSAMLWYSMATRAWRARPSKQSEPVLGRGQGSFRTPICRLAYPRKGRLGLVACQSHY